MQTQTRTARLNPTGSYYFVYCPVSGCNTKVNLPPKAQTQRRSCRKCKTVFNFTLGSGSSASGERVADLPYMLKDVSYVVVATGPDADTAAQVQIDMPSHSEPATVDMSSVMDQMESRIAQHVAQEVSKAVADTTPQVHQINVAGQVEIEVHGDRHEAYADVLESLLVLGNVMLVGPPGSGKSSMIKQIAEDLGKGYSFKSCTDGMSVSELIGRTNPFTDEYKDTDFVRNVEGTGEFAENGGIHLMDEADAMDANTSLVLNEMLSNGMMAVPRYDKPIVNRSPGFMFAAAANTYGTGMQMDMAGRNAMDNAFLDRFVSAVIFVDYDRKRETGIANTYGHMPLVQVLWKIRKNVQESKLRRCVSTRELIHAGKLFASNPEKYTFKFLLERFFAGWSDTEKAKALRDIDVDIELSTAAPEAPALDPTTAGTAPAVAGGPPAGNNPPCPRCGASTVQRIARKGRNAGNPFWGCVNFTKPNPNKCFGAVNIKKEQGAA